MRLMKRIIAYILISVFMLANVFCITFAAVNPAMTSPQMLRIEAKNSAEAPIGYLEGVGYYFDLKWDSLTMPAGEEASAAYVNIYMKEIAKYNGSSSYIQHDRDVPRSVNSMRMSNLKSGTMYNVMARAYYTKTDGNITFTSGESAQSNTVKVLTDIQLAAYSYGPNQIKIEWDDVWDVGKRIDYKLYISQNKDFANAEPMYIKTAQIGPNGPVTPNTSTGKLEYIQNVGDPGAVYYVKVVPDITDTEIKRNKESKTMAVSSYILASTTKMASTDSGTIWRLSWTPVITDLNSSDVDLSYKIYKGTIGSSDLPAYVATVVGNTNYFVTLAPNDNNSFYIIRASVKWKNTGQDVYPVDILSDQIYIKEPETASTPPTPEIVNSFQSRTGQLDSTIISYDDIYNTTTGALIKKGELTSTSATVLWRVPKKATGGIDTDTTYDIWLITDPNMIDTPTGNMKIASSVKMGPDNEVKNGTDVIGYKYKISNLTPNSTYYFKIVAKKSYMEYKDSILTNVPYYSMPALKVIITPTGGPIDQPVVPARPPFKIKQKTDGKNVITSTSATIQLKNMWYEKFNDTIGKWEYIRTEKLNAADNTVPYNPVANPPDNIHYRKVAYDSGVSIDVGCVEFTTDGMDISTLPTQKVTGVPSAAPSTDYVEGRIYNPDQNETASLNVDGKKHNIDIQLTGLQPNTTYIVWLRVERANGSSSGASDPIIITTNPDTPQTVEKPTVPSFNYIKAGDYYADFGWVFKDGYKYYIKYGTVDDIKSAAGSATINAGDYTNYYRVKNLTPNTQYYFWIQAEATLGGKSSQSEWSDSFPLKTLPYIPPNTPLGFGVKNSKDAITKNSITFEWIKEEGIQYILEVSGDISYKNSKEYTAGTVSEYKVDNLKSNFRYFVRLYAYDPNKKLRSEPTQSVTVRTLRSTDDYDSDQDVENVITGDYIVKDSSVKNNVWTIKITGANADRFIEHMQNDRYLDYRIDLSEPPAKAGTLNLQISNKVFRALGSLKENIIVVSGDNQYVLRWGMLYDKTGDFNYEINITTVVNPDNTDVDNLTFKTKVSNVSVYADDGANQSVVSGLNNPLKVLVPYSGADWYKEGVTSAYVYNKAASVWQKAKTTNTFDSNSNSGKLSFETSTPGDMAIADTGKNYFYDVNGSKYEQAVADISTIHPLKSINGRKFEPDKTATISDVIKLMYDVYDYDYSGRDYMTEASKIGLIGSPEIDNPDGKCTREKAVAMIVRLYEMKTKDKAVPSSTYKSTYKDINNVSSAYLTKVKFADENGLISDDIGTFLGPKTYVSRGEVILMLQKLLSMLGEIN